MNQVDPAFKILSLDGGGIRGAFAAVLLTAFEEQSHGPLVEYFDLITGTSTGGIIALGLSLGIPARKIQDFYCAQGATIFPLTGRLGTFRRGVSSAWRVKHSQAPLRSALLDVFGDRRMRHLRTRTVIPAFSATAGQIRLLKTPHHPRITRDGERLLVDVALATSAAPHYLPEAVTDREERFVDGGLWANNPIAVGVTEAIGYLGIPASSVYVLSVGTTRSPYHVRVGALRRGLIGLMGAQPVELVLAAQMTGAHSLAKVLLGGDKRIMRIDPHVIPGRFKLDRSSDVRELIGLGENEATHALPRVLDEFLSQTAAYPYTPGTA